MLVSVDVRPWTPGLGRHSLLAQQQQQMQQQMLQQQHQAIQQ